MTCRLFAALGAAACLLTVAVAAPAFAQSAPSAPAPASPAIVIGVSAGGLLNTNLVDSAATATIYNQSAALAESRDVSGGLLLDVSAAVPVRGRLSAGASVSFRSADSDSAITAVVPHPLFFDAPRTVSTTATGLKSSQTWIGLLGFYTLPSSSKLSLRLFGGPAVVRVSHDTVESFTVTETSDVSAPTIAVTPGNVGRTFWGVEAGGDLTLRVSDRVGIGAMMRYAAAPANVTGAKSTTLGGLEFAAGLRFSFPR
jgi:hypothetical protein